MKRRCHNYNKFQFSTSPLQSLEQKFISLNGSVWFNVHQSKTKYTYIASAIILNSQTRVNGVWTTLFLNVGQKMTSYFKITTTSLYGCVEDKLTPRFKRAYILRATFRTILIPLNSQEKTNYRVNPHKLWIIS